MIRFWPPIALAAMVALGLAVGKGSTSLDDWFHQYGRGPAKWLLLFTDPRVLAILLAGTLAVAVYQRRWRLAVVAVMSTAAALGLVRLLKPLFDRQDGGAPSGHTATMVVVMGVLVLVARAALWAVLVAVAYCALGMIGQGVSYHYFTDTVGALLLGTAIVCTAAWLAEPT